MPDDASRRWASRTEPRLGVRTAVVWEALDPLVAAHADALGRPLDVVDVGGGTGGFAVPLAGLGHRVTVVDPSPDALAALQRRAADAGVAERVHAEQGDAGALLGGRRARRPPTSCSATASWSTSTTRRPQCST